MFHELYSSGSNSHSFTERLFLVWSACLYWRKRSVYCLWSRVRLPGGELIVSFLESQHSSFVDDLVVSFLPSLYIPDISELRNKEIKEEKIITVKGSTYAVAKRKERKNSGLMGFLPLTPVIPLHCSRCLHNLVIENIKSVAVLR